MTSETARVQAIAQRLKDATPLKLLFESKDLTISSKRWIAVDREDIAFLLEQNARLDKHNYDLMEMLARSPDCLNHQGCGGHFVGSGTERKFVEDHGPRCKQFRKERAELLRLDAQAGRP